MNVFCAATCCNHFTKTQNHPSERTFLLINRWPSSSKWPNKLDSVSLHQPIRHMDASENRGTPKSSLLIGFSIIFTIHFGVPLFFGNTHISNPFRRVREVTFTSIPKKFIGFKLQLPLQEIFQWSNPPSTERKDPRYQKREYLIALGSSNLLKQGSVGSQVVLEPPNHEKYDASHWKSSPILGMIFF